MKEILSAQHLTMTVEAYAVYRERLLTEPERFEDANTAARIASEVFRGLPKGRKTPGPRRPGRGGRRS